MSRPAHFVAIVGATGTGKSSLSLSLAEHIAACGGRAEIVNADAMQLYRGMDIGTAKVPQAERRGVAHHLLDVLAVTDEASVARYQREARAAVTEILLRGHVAILVGGSGLYVSAVIHDFTFPPHDVALRRSLEEEAARHGLAPLVRRLRAHFPEAAQRVDLENPRRVVRALEAAQLGEAGQIGRLPDPPRPWRDVTVVGLHAERGNLVSALDERVRRMWRDGLVREVEGLLAAGLARATTAGRAIGYAQALAQLRGESAADEAIAETQRRTRRYARRQEGWFRRYAEARWITVVPGEAPPTRAAAAHAGW
ncbi:MAG TPA: tRNA (adenosine(37)-N6)-dimethylallyltransferase MiaA [Microbacteriaceae bacterium]|nr:tRNA (adenosine(37)-N6)-dimethylallyltransferase MiaA [Microbacteriaceae bacterium]